jgi:carnitine-CoA ligase
MVDRVTEVHDLQPPRELSNRDLWRWRVQHTPDRRWLWHAGETWTYGEFDLEMRRLASGLRELGVGPGTRVLVGMSTRPETVLTHLALGELGAVRVLLVPGLPLDELMFPIVHSEAPMIVADDPIASMLLEHRDACSSIKQLVVLTDGDPGAGADVHRFEELAGSSPLAQEAPEEDDVQALSYVIYTSGSTGRPKGVMLKAGSLYHCGLGYSDLYSFRADDNYFQPLTFGHSLASIAGLGIPMVTGGSVSLVERFRPSTFWSQVQDSGATISVLFPAHLNLVLETDDGAMEKGSSSMRYIVTHTDIPAFRDRFGIELGTIWGMSETLICVGSDPGYRGELGPGYVGHPFAGGEVGIFDEKFTRVGPYQYGELCLRHPMVMLGYLKDAEATAATLRDGWVRSGDRGYVDHTGRAFFAGRYKAMIKRSGENVSAEEVEAALGEHADVAECAVVAVPDRLRTEEVGAVVVRRAGAAADPASLRAQAAERLIRWKLPRYILVRDDPLPRLGNGKIDRTGVAALIDPESVWDAEES